MKLPALTWYVMARIDIDVMPLLYFSAWWSIQSIMAFRFLKATASTNSRIRKITSSLMLSALSSFKKPLRPLHGWHTKPLPM